MRGYFLKSMVVAYELPLPIDNFGDEEIKEFLNEMSESLRYRVKVQDQSIVTSELDVNYLFTFRIIFNCKVGYLTLSEYEKYFNELREEFEIRFEDFFSSKDVYYMPVLSK